MNRKYVEKKKGQNFFANYLREQISDMIRFFLFKKKRKSKNEKKKFRLFFVTVKKK